MPRRRHNVDTDLQALVRRAQHGDPEASGALYHRLTPKIYRFLLAETRGQVQLAEDLTDEVLLKALERLGQYQDRGVSFTTWVYRVARNHLIDYLRRLPRHGTVPIEACFSIAAPGADESFDRRLAQRELAEALECLTEDQRQVVALRFLRDLTLLDTARIIGKTEDAVKKLQMRGLRALRKALVGRPVREPAA